MLTVRVASYLVDVLKCTEVVRSKVLTPYRKFVNDTQTFFLTDKGLYSGPTFKESVPCPRVLAAARDHGYIQPQQKTVTVPLRKAR